MTSPTSNIVMSRYHSSTLNSTEPQTPREIYQSRNPRALPLGQFTTTRRGKKQREEDSTNNAIDAKYFATERLRQTAQRANSITARMTEREPRRTQSQNSNDDVVSALIQKVPSPRESQTSINDNIGSVEFPVIWEKNLKNLEFDMYDDDRKWYQEAHIGYTGKKQMPAYQSITIKDCKISILQNNRVGEEIDNPYAQQLYDSCVSLCKEGVTLGYIQEVAFKNAEYIMVATGYPVNYDMKKGRAYKQKDVFMNWKSKATKKTGGAQDVNNSYGTEVGKGDGKEQVGIFAHEPEKRQILGFALLKMIKDLEKYFPLTDNMDNETEVAYRLRKGQNYVEPEKIKRHLYVDVICSPYTASTLGKLMLQTLENPELYGNIIGYEALALRAISDVYTYYPMMNGYVRSNGNGNVYPLIYVNPKKENEFVLYRASDINSYSFPLALQGPEDEKPYIYANKKELYEVICNPVPQRDKNDKIMRDKKNDMIPKVPHVFQFLIPYFTLLGKTANENEPDTPSNGYVYSKALPKLSTGGSSDIFPDAMRLIIGKTNNAKTRASLSATNKATKAIVNADTKADVLMHVLSLVDKKTKNKVGFMLRVATEKPTKVFLINYEASNKRGRNLIKISFERVYVSKTVPIWEEKVFSKRTDAMQFLQSELVKETIKTVLQSFSHIVVDKRTSKATTPVQVCKWLSELPI